MATAPAHVQPAASASLANAVHIVMAPKGGVGKTAISSWLAQYFEQPVLDDVDPTTATFSKFSGLNVKRWNLLDEGGQVDNILFDGMVNTILENSGPFVIDTGSSTFLELRAYIASNDLFSFLAENNRPAILHVPIAGGADLAATVEGFTEICRIAPDRSVVIWLNHRDQPLQVAGQDFAQTPVAKENAAKILGAVTLVHQWMSFGRAHRQAVARMLTERWTFVEAIKNMDTMDRVRIGHVRKELFKELEAIGL